MYLPRERLSLLARSKDTPGHVWDARVPCAFLTSHVAIAIGCCRSCTGVRRSKSGVILRSLFDDARHGQSGIVGAHGPLPWPIAPVSPSLANHEPCVCTHTRKKQGTSSRDDREQGGGCCIRGLERSERPEAKRQATLTTHTDVTRRAPRAVAPFLPADAISCAKKILRLLTA